MWRYASATRRGRVARAEAGAHLARGAPRREVAAAARKATSALAESDDDAANDMGVRCESASRRARATKTTRGTDLQ